MPLFRRSKSSSISTAPSLRELLRIQTKIAKETGIRLVHDIKINPDIYIYHGVLPAMAKDETDRDVFVKILLSRDPGKRAQFERESWICSHFRHDHLVRKEFSRSLALGGTLGRVSMIVLEHIEGIDVAQLLDYLAISGAKLGSAVALEIGIKILRALDDVHTHKDRHGKEMSIVHADVSPQNILLSRKGQVKLIDFGIANITDDPFAIPPPRAGKPGYMAPEQIFTDTFDHRVDLYAAGVVIAEMLTAKRLAGVNDLDRARRTELNRVYAERLLASELDAVLQDTLSNAIHEDPNKRYRNAKEFIQALEGYAQNQGMVFRADGIAHMVVEVMDYVSMLETRQQTARNDDAAKREDVKHHPQEPERATNHKQRWSWLPRISTCLPYGVGVMIAVAIILSLKFDVRPPESQAGNLQEPEVPTAQGQVISGVAVKPDTESDNGPVTPVREDVRQKTGTQKVQAVADQAKAAQKTVPPATKTGHGTLFVGASPWAEISIPGYASERPIPFSIKLAEGWHKVSARYQNVNGEWLYLAKSVRINPGARHTCQAHFDGKKRMVCW